MKLETWVMTLGKIIGTQFLLAVTIVHEITQNTPNFLLGVIISIFLMFPEYWFPLLIGKKRWEREKGKEV